MTVLGPVVNIPSPGDSPRAGVGFDLIPSYGTAAVHYYNGTVIEVTKIAGNSHYLKLMGDLAKPWDRTRNFVDTFLLRLEELLLVSGASSFWRDWLRSLKEKLGWQAKANDVEIIRDLIYELMQATEEAISQPLDRVAVTAPDLPSLNKGTISAALRDLNLHTWVGDSLFYTRRLSAVY